MSLNRLALRLAVLSALNNNGLAPWPTLAGERVYDSAINDLEDIARVGVMRSGQVALLTVAFGRGALADVHEQIYRTIDLSAAHSDALGLPLVRAPLKPPLVSFTANDE